MKKRFLFSLLGVFTLLLTGCNSLKQSSTLVNHTSSNADEEYTYSSDDDFSSSSYEYDSSSSETISVHSHYYGLWKVVNEPTKENTGLLNKKCVGCDDVVEYELPVLNEDDYSYIKTTATCKREGKEQYKIKVDNQVFTFVVTSPMIDHELSEWYVDVKPTLTSKGLLKAKCKYCYEEKGSFELPILNKDDYVFNTKYEATCKDKGVDEYTYSKDNQTFTFEVTTDYSEHVLGDWMIYSEPTKEYGGTILRYCANCSYCKSFSLPRLNETDYQVTNVLPTCTEDGYSEYVYIKDGQRLTFKTELSATGHTTKKPTVITEPTKETTGLLKRKCESCDYEETFVLPKLNNTDYDVYHNVDDCDYGGTDNYEYTLDCGDNYNYHYYFYVKIAPQEHNFVDCKCTDCRQWAVSFKDSSSNKNDYAVSALNYKDLTEITIPSKYNNCTVTEIAANAFKDCSNLKKVILPDTINYIGQYAFTGSGIEEIVIPDSVKKIDNYAFSDCESLKKVTLSNNLTYLGEYAFTKTSIEEIVIPDTITEIKEGTFKDCTQLSDITFPNNLTTIKSDAFENIGIVDLVIPDTVTEIYYAFQHCTHLAKVTLGTGLTYCDLKAFRSCYSLIEIINLSQLTYSARDLAYIPSYLTIHSTEDSECTFIEEDDNRFFLYNDKLYFYEYFGTNGTTHLPHSVTVNGKEYKNYDIYKYAFYINNVITSVYVPNAVSEIGDYAFAYCSNLSELILGDNITNVGEYLFAYTDKLESINIPENFTFSSYTFENAPHIIEIYDPFNKIGAVNSYGFEIVHSSINEASSIHEQDDYHFFKKNDKYYLFNYVGDSDELILPEKYKNSAYYIYDYAFYYISSIKNLSIPDSILGVGKNIVGNFLRPSWATEETSTQNIKGTDYTYTYTYLGNENNPYLVLYYVSNSSYDIKYNLPLTTTINSKTEIIADNALGLSSGGHYPKYSGTVTIPENVRTIGKSSFQFNEALTSLVFASNSQLKIIEDNAFYSCSIKQDLEIPEGVTYIGNWAFHGNNLTSLTLPKTISYIGKYAFEGTFSSLILPKSIKEIGDYAFNSVSGLENIFYEGTEDDYSKIEKGKYIYPFYSGTVYYYSEEAPTTSGNYWHYVDGEPTIWPRV